MNTKPPKPPKASKLSPGAPAPAAPAAPAPPAPAAPVAAIVPTPATGGFELESGIAVPAAHRGGHGATKYPFDAMEVGQSFHVASTAERLKPARTLASVVSSATARYAKPAKDGATRVNRNDKTVPVMVNTRTFVIRSVDSTDPKGEGARIFRIV